MSRLREHFFASVAFAAIALVCASEGCGNKSAGSGFETPPTVVPVADDASGAGSDDSSTGGVIDPGNGVPVGLGSLDAGRPPPPVATCKLPGLWCYQTKAPCTTSLSGTVYDPA